MAFLLNNQYYAFTFRRWFSLLTILLFMILCKLGVWQLHRYHYKQQLLNTYQSHLHAAPVPFASLTDFTQFQNVEVKGQYRNDLTMVVQNRFYNDQLGFEVLTPLRIPGDKKLLLIDRGWIAKDKLTLFKRGAAADITVHGYIKTLDEYQFILGKNILDTTSKPLMMQKIDIADISNITQQSFYPFILRLSPDDENGFVRDWTITAVMPQKHLGYAIQWFLMALVLMTAYFCFSIEKMEPK